jgi:predicted nucleotidyltransferase
VKPIRAVYEGGVFRPLESVALEDQTEVLVEAVAGRPRSRAAILQVPRRELPRLRERYAVSRLVLFGSAARDELGPESDVDFVVEFSREPALTDLLDLAGELTLLLDRQADLATSPMLKTCVREAVEREGVPV